VAETVLPEEGVPNPPEKSWLWVAAEKSPPDPYQWSRTPLSALVYLRIVNQNSIDETISELTFEVKTSKGWKTAFFFNGPRLFVVAGSDFTNAAEVRGEMLADELREKGIGANKTVSGWLALVFPRISISESKFPDFRVTIADTLGGKTTVEAGKVYPGNLSHNSLTVVGRKDISDSKVILIQDIPAYWKEP
jgi:hypothetical protein